MVPSGTELLPDTVRRSLADPAEIGKNRTPDTPYTQKIGWASFLRTSSNPKQSDSSISTFFIKNFMRAVSLFSGCGGSDAGVIAAGFDVVMANDIIAYARDAYLANLPETEYILGDVAKLNNFPDAELLLGCYPCQGYSQGGARKVDRGINYLFTEFGRALRAIQPKAFIVENVSGLTRKDNAPLFNRQIRNFRQAGYRVTWKLLNAANFGVAQERERVIIVGLRSDLGLTYNFPTPTHGPDTNHPYHTIGQALAGLPDWPEGEFNAESFHWYYLSRNRRRNWNEVSKTIVAHMRHMPLHPISPALTRIHTDKWEFTEDLPARRFSYREAARLQGLTTEYLTHGGDFIFPEICTHANGQEGNAMRYRYKVIGNAVPPPLFEAVAKALPNVWD